jgi:hypothetical protein
MMAKVATCSRDARLRVSHKTIVAISRKLANAMPITGQSGSLGACRVIVKEVSLTELNP